MKGKDVVAVDRKAGNLALAFVLWAGKKSWGQGWELKAKSLLITGMISLNLRRDWLILIYVVAALNDIIFHANLPHQLLTHAELNWAEQESEEEEGTGELRVVRALLKNNNVKKQFSSPELGKILMECYYVLDNF